MKFKNLLLFSILLVPIVIVLFLRLFGSNKFEIPIYFEDSIPVDNCSTNYQVPYSLWQTYTLSKWIEKGKITLIGIIDKNNLKSKIEFFEEILRRNNNAIEFEIIILSENTFKSDIITFVEQPAESLKSIGNCELLVTEIKEIEDPQNFFVLLDKEGRVRGYYQIGNLDELDRLLVEVDILDNDE